MVTKRKSALSESSSAAAVKEPKLSKKKAQAQSAGPIAMPYISEKKTNQSVLSSSHTFKEGVNTRLIVRYDVGFSNHLYLRGSAPDLSWDKGTLLKNISPDEWVWEPSQPFTSCEFKVLLNDEIYEQGNNRSMIAGSCLEYTPKF